MTNTNRRQLNRRRVTKASHVKMVVVLAALGIASYGLGMIYQAYMLYGANGLWANVGQTFGW